MTLLRRNTGIGTGKIAKNRAARKLLGDVAMKPEYKASLQALGYSVESCGPRSWLVSCHGRNLHIATSERSAWLAAADEAFYQAQARAEA